MENFVYSTTGWIHLTTSIIALITGTMILAMKKGTATHIKVGYIYVISMLIVVVTAFMIYRLFDGRGIFHCAAVVSGVTLASGMVPVIFRRPKKRLVGSSFQFYVLVSDGALCCLHCRNLGTYPRKSFLWYGRNRHRTGNADRWDFFLLPKRMLGERI